MLGLYFNKILYAGESINLFFLNDGILSGAATAAWTWLVSLFRILLAQMDRIMIWLINSSYELIMDIADAQVFNEMILELFGNRIYILIALFMLFKISITLIRYLADPDAAADSNVGMGNMVKKAVLALGLLALVPILFQEAYRFQTFIIRNQTIATFILGVPHSPTIENAQLVSFGVYSAFFYPNPDVVGESCQHVYYISDGLSQECRQALLASSTAGEDADMELVVDVYDNAIQTQNAEYLMSGLLVGATTQDNEFVFSYQWIISGIVAFIVALILISFCFDIAIRTVKLGFLQLIAPIPILSSVDPNSKLLEKWTQTTIMTFLDLFIRLIAIFFAIFVISLIKAEMGGITRFSTGEPIESNLVIVVVIVGALLFAKQLPNLIADLLGTKFEGSMELNPLNRLKATPGVGKAIGLTTGAIGGAAGGYIAGKSSGTQWRGMRHGMFVGASSGSKGIGMAGEAEGAKEHYSVYKGMQEAHKDYTGNEMARLRSEDIVKAAQGIPIIGRVAKWDQKAIEREMARVDQPIKDLKTMENNLQSQYRIEERNLAQTIGQQRQTRARKRSELLSKVSEQDRASFNQELVKHEQDETRLHERLQQLQRPSVRAKLKTAEEKQEHDAKINKVNQRLQETQQKMEDSLKNRKITVDNDIRNKYIKAQENFEQQNKSAYYRLDYLLTKQTRVGKALKVFNDRKQDISKAGNIDESSEEKFSKAIKDYEELKSDEINNI